jgi:chromosome segregation ATPase
MSDSVVGAVGRGRKLRRMLVRLLTGVDLAQLATSGRQSDDQMAAVVEWIRGAEQHLATLQNAYDDQHRRLNSLLQWMDGAEQHLGGLQEAHERLSSTHRPGTEPIEAIHARLIEPVLNWIRGAEQHLTALQEDHARLRALHERQVAQLDRITARTALIDARLGDLERADTEIAVAVAKRGIRPEGA